jgi:hypothetical protein
VSFTIFVNDYRKLQNVRESYAVGLDIDRPGTTFEGTVAALADFRGIVHTTWSSGVSAPQLRAFVWVSRPVAADGARRCWRYLRDRLRGAGQGVGEEAKDPSRLWYVPARHPDREYSMAELTGAMLDVGAVLDVMPERVEHPETPAPIARVVVGRADVVERARKYVAACPPAISGSGGHRHTFLIAQRLVRGFELDPATAFSLMTAWNRTCQPPWSARELAHKISEAGRVGQMPLGILRSAPWQL